MAYHDTHHVAAGDILKQAGRSVLRFFGHIFDALAFAAEGNRRLKVVERLQAKSDEELAAMGLRREDIVRHAFRDVFFT
jgi:hypothetical protein